MGIWNFLKSRPQPPAEAYAPPRTDSAADRKMDRVLLQRLIDIRALCGGTGDLIDVYKRQSQYSSKRHRTHIAHVRAIFYCGGG